MSAKLSSSEHTPEEWTRLHGEKHPIAGFLYLVYGITIVVNYIIFYVHNEIDNGSDFSPSKKISHIVSK